MKKLRIYNQYAAQIEPETDRIRKADDKVRKLIDESVVCWIDTNQRRIYSKVRANWFGSGGTRLDQYGAVWESGTVDSLLIDFANELEKLEESEQWTNFVKSAEQNTNVGYNFPWLLRSARGRSLKELGLTKGQKFTIIKLLEDGNQLTLGVQDHEAAAIALSCFSRDIEEGIEIAISDSGRNPATKTADLVLEPNSEVNFDATTESSKKILQEQFEQLEQNLANEFKSDVRTARTSLLDSWEDDFWQQYDELQEIRQEIDYIVGNANESGNPQSEAGNRIIELIESIYYGRTVEGRYNLDLLSESSVQDQIDWVQSWLADECRDIERNVSTRAENLLSDILADVDSRDREDAYLLVSDMLKRVDQNIYNRGTDDSVLDHFDTFYQWLETGDLLSPAESGRLQRETRVRLIDKANEYEKAEYDEIKEEFERAIENLGYGSTNQVTVLKQAIGLLEESQRPEAASLSRRSKFRRVVDRLDSNEILLTEQQDEIRSDVLETLREEKRTVLKKRRQYWNRRFRSKVDQLKNEASEIKDWFQNLCEIKLHLESDDHELPDDRPLKGFQRELQSLADDDTLGKIDVRRVRESLAANIDDAITTAREELRSNLTQSVDRLVERIPSDGESLDTAVTDLSALKQRVNRGSGGRLSDDIWVGKIDEKISLVQSGSYKGIPYFSSSTSVTTTEIQDSFEEAIESRLSELRSQRRDELIHEFDNTLNILKQTKVINNAYLVSLIESLQSELGVIPGSTNYDIELTNSDLDQHRSQLFELVRIANRTESDEILSRKETRSLQDEYERILDEVYQEEQELLEKSISRTIKRDLKEKYDIAIDKNENIAELQSTGTNLETIRSGFENVKQNMFYYINEVDVSESTADAFLLLEDERKVSVADSIVEWVDTEHSRVQKLMSEQAREKLLKSFESIESTYESPGKKLEEYAVVRSGLNETEPSVSTDLKAVSDVHSLTAVLQGNDRQAVANRLTNQREAALEEFETSLHADWQAELDDIEANRDNPYVAFESLLDNLGENEGPIHEIANRITGLERNGVLTSSEAASITNNLKDSIRDSKKAADPPVGASALSKPRTILIGVVILAAGLLIVGLLTFPVGELGTSNDGTASLSGLQVQSQGQNIIVDGTVTRTPETVEMVVSGPQSAVHRTINVTSGRFQTSIADVDSGSYTISFRPAGNSTSWTNISTVVSSSEPPFTISGLSVHPDCSGNGGLLVSGNASESVNSLTLRTEGPETTSDEEVPVRNGTFEVRLENYSQETLTISLRPSTTPAHWTNFTTSQIGSSEATVDGSAEYYCS